MIMRTASKADPDPELLTVALRIWPRMLLVTVDNLACLTYIAGVSGKYVFFAVVANFLASFAVLWKTVKVTEKKNSEDSKGQIPKEEIPRLAIKNEKDVPSKDGEESEDAPIEMSLLTESGVKEQQAEDEKKVQIPATGTSEDAEELKTEGAQTEGAQIPPSTELPGADSSKDVESQGEEQETKTKSETGLDKAKEEEENFLFDASICSTWIPSVVGDPEQRFFLKAGEVFYLSLLCVEIHFTLKNHPGVVSLVTKRFFLVVAFILATFGIHKARPFLLHCVDQNSTLGMDKHTLCTDLTDCFSQPTKANFTDLSGVLRLLEEAHRNLDEEVDKAAFVKEVDKAAFVKEANKITLVKEKIKLMRTKVEEAQNLGKEVKDLQKMERNPEKLQQKVRVCGKQETTIRVVTLSSLVSLLVLASLATYQLHKITDYKVGQSLSQYWAEKFKRLVSGAL